MQNKKILVISPEPWGINFVSKHHYANYLAQDNTVYFLNPPKGFTKWPLKGIQAVIQPQNNGLIIVEYLNLLPRLNHFPKWIQRLIYKKQSKQLQKKIAVSTFDIVWSFDPNRFFDQTVWNADKTIYHTVDFHPNSPNEKDIILSSDLFVGVIDLILDDHKSYRQGELIPHAADIQGFKTTKKITLPGNNETKAIYTGNFHKHINYTLLKELVVNNPDCDFIMIGPTERSNLSTSNSIEPSIFEDLTQQKNIFFIGSVAGQDLMSYLLKADLNLVLFEKKHERIHCSPHKLMAYFYSGNLTLSNYIDAHKNTDSDIIQMINSYEEFGKEFTAIVQKLSFYNSTELADKRRNFAIENSYPNKIDEIEKLLYSK